MLATASRYFRPKSLRHRCRSILGHRAPEMVTCGRPDIGATHLKATTGSPECGRGRRKWAFCGRLVIGALWEACIAITTDLGAGMSATTAVLTMDSVTAAPATRVVIGAGTASTTTVPSTT